MRSRRAIRSGSRFRRAVRRTGAESRAFRCRAFRFPRARVRAARRDPPARSRRAAHRASCRHWRRAPAADGGSDGRATCARTSMPRISPSIDVGAVQHDQPVRRAHERVVVVAPAHRLGNRQRLQCVREDLGDKRRQSAALSSARDARTTRLCRFRVFPAARLRRRTIARNRSGPWSADRSHRVRHSTPGRGVRSA